MFTNDPVLLGDGLTGNRDPVFRAIQRVQECTEVCGWLDASRPLYASYGSL
jgi:hypothetical protein